MFVIKENAVKVNDIEKLLENVQEEFEARLLDETEPFWLCLHLPKTVVLSEDILMDWRRRLSVMLQRIPAPFIFKSLIVDEELTVDADSIGLRGLVVYHGLDPYYVG